MQPYLFPYIGYFQLIHSVDEFVIYDNIKYTKKGWINRNKILSAGSPKLFTLPIKKDSDFLNVNERKVSESWIKEKEKTLKPRKRYIPHIPPKDHPWRRYQDRVNYQNYINY